MLWQQLEISDALLLSDWLFLFFFSYSGCLCRYAMIDEGETDWKILAIDIKDPLADKINGLSLFFVFFFLPAIRMKIGPAVFFFFF